MQIEHEEVQSYLVFGVGLQMVLCVKPLPLSDVHTASEVTRVSFLMICHMCQPLMAVIVQACLFFFM